MSESENDSEEIRMNYRFSLKTNYDSKNKGKRLYAISKFSLTLPLSTLTHLYPCSEEIST